MAFFASKLFLFISLSMVSARLRTPPTLGRFYVNWDGGLKGCKGFDNKIIDSEKLVVERKSKTLLALVGTIEIPYETTKNISCKLTILKRINGNYEYYMTVEESDLCKHVEEKNKPWSVFLKEMDISGCPIPKKVYTLKNSTLDTAGFPLTVATAGHYRGTLELYEDGVLKVCVISNAVIEQL